MHTQYDPTSNYTANIVDFSSHQNIKISKQVVPRTTRDYIRFLFDPPAPRADILYFYDILKTVVSKIRFCYFIG
jgi:hypothetical protein